MVSSQLSAGCLARGAQRRRENVAHVLASGRLAPDRQRERAELAHQADAPQMAIATLVEQPPDGLGRQQREEVEDPGEMLQLRVVAVFFVATEHVPGADVAIEDAIDIGVVENAALPRLLERG